MLGRLKSLGRGWTPRLAALLAAVTPAVLQRRGFWLDLGDIMFVAARKAARRPRPVQWSFKVDDGLT